MGPKKVYKVFISSTYLDNQDRRKNVQDAVMMAGMLWHGMEIFPAASQSAVKKCLQFVKEADVLVGIIAHRYGWEPEGKISITEMEYNTAKERLMFLIDPELSVRPEKDFDPGPDKWKKQEKLENFKKSIMDDPEQTHTNFNETNLGAKVLYALNHWRQEKERKKEKEREEERKKNQKKTQAKGPGEEQGKAEIDEGKSKRTKPCTSFGFNFESKFDSQFDKEIENYCHKIKALHETLPIAGFVTRLQVPIDIEEIYVPLRAMIDLRRMAEKTFMDADHAEQ